MTKKKREKFRDLYVIDTNRRIRMMISWDTDKRYYLDYKRLSARQSIGGHGLRWRKRQEFRFRRNQDPRPRFQLERICSDRSLTDTPRDFHRHPAKKKIIFLFNIKDKVDKVDKKVLCRKFLGKKKT